MRAGFIVGHVRFRMYPRVERPVKRQRFRRCARSAQARGLALDAAYGAPYIGLVSVVRNLLVLTSLAGCSVPIRGVPADAGSADAGVQTCASPMPQECTSVNLPICDVPSCYDTNGRQPCTCAACCLCSMGAWSVSTAVDACFPPFPDAGSGADAGHAGGALVDAGAVDAGLGDCGGSCPNGGRCCAGRCANTATDPFNCNGCGIVCGGETPFCGTTGCIGAPCTLEAVQRCSTDGGNSCCNDSCCGDGQICCTTSAAPEGECLSPTANQPSCP
jgi:hypothetical protein